MKELLDNLHWAWITIAALLAIIEILAPFFGFIFAAVAALVAALAAALHVAWELQLVIFAVALLLALGVLRPRVIHKLQAGSRGVPSRTAALIGKKGTVIQPGRAEFNGEDWAISSTDQLEVGAHVRVVGADGLVLHVKKVT